MIKRYTVIAYARVSIDVAAFDEDEAVFDAQDADPSEYTIDRIIEIEEVEDVD